MEVVLTEELDEEEQLVKRHRKEKKELQGEGGVGTETSPDRPVLGSLGLGFCIVPDCQSSQWPLPLRLPCPGGPFML